MGPWNGYIRVGASAGFDNLLPSYIRNVSTNPMILKLKKRRFGIPRLTTCCLPMIPVECRTREVNCKR